MNKLQIRQLERMQARVAYMTVNAADFPATSPGGRTTAAMRTVISNIETLSARKVSGAISQNVEIKDENIEKLERLTRKVNKAARSAADEITGIDELFKMGRESSEEAILARARSFHANSEAHQAVLIEYGLDDDFRKDLNDLITAVTDSAEDTDNAQADRGGAVGALKEEFRKGNRLGAKLDGIVKIKYDDDPDKLAAWLIASHLRAADKDDEDEETPPTEGGTPTGNG